MPVLMSLRRVAVTLLVVGALTGLVWQLLSPIGAFTVRPLPATPEDYALVPSDGIFVLLSAVTGVIAGVAFLVWSSRRVSAQDLILAWVFWLSCGVLGVVASVGTGVAVEHAARAITHQPAGHGAVFWELSSWVPLVVWPMVFCLVVAVGEMLASVRGDAVSETGRTPRRSPRSFGRSTSPCTEGNPPDA